MTSNAVAKGVMAIGAGSWSFVFRIVPGLLLSMWGRMDRGVRDGIAMSSNALSFPASSDDFRRSNHLLWPMPLLAKCPDAARVVKNKRAMTRWGWDWR